MIATHEHKKTGNKYQLLMITNQESTKDSFIKTAVYLDTNGAIWSRAYNEFIEKFRVYK